jgi:hypothetical protein
MVRNSKRQALSTPSPTKIDTTTMEPSMSELNAKLDLLVGTIGKIHEIDAAVKGLVQENAALRADLATKDEKIKSLTDQLNRVDQAARSTSLRILGLPVTTQSSPANVFDAVYKEILVPILDAAKKAGDLDSQATLPPHFLIVNAFAIPAKNNASSSPVIVKLHSEFIRALVFKHKKAALPTALDLSSNRVRNKYSVFEDLSPATHSLFRVLADDIRVKSVWSYRGQIRFKGQDSETVYKVKSLTDTFDSLVKPTG